MKIALEFESVCKTNETNTLSSQLSNRSIITEALYMSAHPHIQPLWEGILLTTARNRVCPKEWNGYTVFG